MSTERPQPTAMAWRKSSHSEASGGNCLEVADGHFGAVPVRDSKTPHGPTLALPRDAWRTFVTAVRRGELSY